jgi:hypothetical protein
MKPNALLALAVCLFAAFAAAWTKEGAYMAAASRPMATCKCYIAGNLPVD